MGLKMRDLLANPKDLDGEELAALIATAQYSAIVSEEGHLTLHAVGDEEKLAGVSVKKKDAVAIVKTTKGKDELPVWAKNKHGLPIVALHCALDEEAEPPKAVEAPVGEVKQ